MRLTHNYGHLIWMIKTLLKMIEEGEYNEEFIEEARFIVVTEEHKLLPPSKQPRD